jgi:hypothetical protein
MPLSSSCERCGSQILPAAQIAPLGNEPGHDIYYCQSCDHYTWIERAQTKVQREQQTESNRKKSR